MHCVRCGQSFERAAPFCGVCGLRRTQVIASRVTSAITLLSAVMIQATLWMPWMTLTLPYTNGEQVSFSMYDAQTFLTALGNTVGGIDDLEHWIVGTNVFLVLMQTVSILLGVCGVCGMIKCRRSTTVAGLSAASVSLMLSLAAMWALFDFLDHWKTSAVQLTPAVLIAVAVALTATTAMAIYRKLTANDHP